MQALGIAIFLERQTKITGGLPLVYNPGSAFRLMTVLTLTTGTCFIMWLGEQITERGIGNGMSLIIFAGIVVGLAARGDSRRIDQIRTGQLGLIRLILLVVVMVVVDRPRSSSSSAGTAGSPCSTPSAWSAGGCTAARARTSR